MPEIFLGICVLALIILFFSPYELRMDEDDL